jgi:hypothetical protein
VILTLHCYWPISYAEITQLKRYCIFALNCAILSMKWTIHQVPSQQVQAYVHDSFGAELA